MPQKKSGDGMSLPKGPSCDCGPVHGCRVEAVLSVDERGQMVLPKDVREKARIRAGDKLALIGWEQDGKICCIMLYPVEQFSEPVKAVMAPMIKDLL